LIFKEKIMHSPETLEDLLALGGGYRQAKTFLAACELDIFTHLTDGCSAGDLAEKLQLNPRALEILLDGLTALGLLEKEAGVYRNRPVAQAYLVSSQPGYRGHILRHLNHCWPAWSELEKTLASGRPPDEVEAQFLFADEGKNQDYIWGMEDVAHRRVEAVLEVLDLGGVERLLDLGGGPATYSIAFCKRYPELSVVLFDLPLSLKVARENIARHGLTGRIHLQAGDFLADEFGSGFQVVWISQILHGNSEAACQKLLRKAATALTPGGRVVVQDFWLDATRTQPPSAAIFSVHMLAVAPGGRVYTVEEISRWLEEANLEDISSQQVEGGTVLVSGRKPHEGR